MNINSNMAVLIDGDNIPSAPVKEMMEEITEGPMLKIGSHPWYWDGFDKK